MGLNVIQLFDEGEFVLANKLKFVRRYVTDTKDSSMFTHFTEVFDSRIAESGGAFRGQIGVFHGYLQC